LHFITKLTKKDVLPSNKEIEKIIIITNKLPETIPWTAPAKLKYGEK